MAQRVVTELVDDYDGKTIKGGQGGTVQLSLDGVDYELDLSDRNRAALDKALTPYITAARGSAAGAVAPTAPRPRPIPARPKPSASGPPATATTYRPAAASRQR